jgi:L,D-transpeptidase YbiS
MIHGTLYERLLGRSVSHGCIRVGRDDLRKIYRAASVGTPIFIF